MANYRALLLQQTREFVEGASFDLNFMVKDELNDVVQNASFSSFKFYCKITNDSDELVKYDVNYASGAATQLETSGNEVIVHVVETDTTDWEGIYWIELHMINKTTSNDYVIWKGMIEIVDTITD